MKTSDFDTRIQFPEYVKQGAEPSLKTVIYRYYSQFMDSAGAEAFTQQYI